jgi:hypothetical protein
MHQNGMLIQWRGQQTSGPGPGGTSGPPSTTRSHIGLNVKGLQSPSRTTRGHGGCVLYKYKGSRTFIISKLCSSQMSKHTIAAAAFLPSRSQVITKSGGIRPNKIVSRSQVVSSSHDPKVATSWKILSPENI